jgi:hypothetical protein
VQTVSSKHSTEQLSSGQALRCVLEPGKQECAAEPQGGKGGWRFEVFRLADLVELLRDGGTDDASVEGGDVGADERREGARRAVGLYHVPQHRLLPLVELPVRVPPPEPARHARAPSPTGHYSLRRRGLATAGS